MSIGKTTKRRRFLILLMMVVWISGCGLGNYEKTIDDRLAEMKKFDGLYQSLGTPLDPPTYNNAVVKKTSMGSMRVFFLPPKYFRSELQKDTMGPWGEGGMLFRYTGTKDHEGSALLFGGKKDAEPVELRSPNEEETSSQQKKSDQKEEPQEENLSYFDYSIYALKDYHQQTYGKPLPITDLVVEDPKELEVLQKTRNKRPKLFYARLSYDFDHKGKSWQYLIHFTQRYERNVTDKADQVAIIFQLPKSGSKTEEEERNKIIQLSLRSLETGISSILLQKMFDEKISKE